MMRVPWLLRGLVIVMFVVCCVMTAWLVVRPHIFVTSLIFIATYPLGTVILLWVAWLNHQARRLRVRNGWLWLASVPLLMLFGDLTMVGLEQQGRPLFPSVADIFYFATVPLFFLAFRSFSGKLSHSLVMWQRRLDVAICMLSLTIYVWKFLLSSIILTYSTNPPTLVLFLLGATLLLIPFSIALLTLWRDEALNGVHRLSFILALATFAALILLFFVRHAAGAFSTSHASAALSVWTIFLFAMSAFLGLRSEREQPQFWLRQHFSTLSRLLPYVPYIAMGASFLLLFDLKFIRQAAQQNLSPEQLLERVGVLLGSVLISVLVITRQILTMRENHRLNRALQAFSRELEQRVTERTKQLEDSHARLAASERLASLGRISAGLAHEINTPVASAMNSLRQAQHLAEEYEASIDNKSVTDIDHHEIASELKQALTSTDSSLERLGEFVRRMRGQVHAPSGKSDFDVVRVVKDTLAMLEHRAKKAKIHLVFEAPPPFLFYGDAARFSQVVSNLVVNALDACEDNWRDNSTVTVRLEQTPEGLTLEVQDNGAGIPKNLKEKIFEPLFTTKEIGKGTGLGLAIIQDIVYGYFDGRLTLESEVGCGTTFSIVLPNQKVTLFREAPR
jgi:signal transduction histidine kinase